LGVLSWIVFGLIAGVIAKFLMPGRDPGGCIITMLLGVVGAFVGGFIYKLVTGTELLYFGFDLRSFAVAVLGAVAVLAVYRLTLRSGARDRARQTASHEDLLLGLFRRVLTVQAGPTGVATEKDLSSNESGTQRRP
jgi:uncharacterized membrane protein YeaQ/YmgE (transglycosylase-associated protein family)